MMFCVKCGASLPDGAQFCSVCGHRQSDGQSPATPQSPQGNNGYANNSYNNVPPPPQPNMPAYSQTNITTTVPNYLTWAILATICCCVPTGVAAIIYSTQVNKHLLEGNMNAARSASENAKLWCILSLLGGVIAIFLGIIGGVFQNIAANQ